MPDSAVHGLWFPPFFDAKQVIAASSPRDITLEKRPDFLSHLGINPAKLNLPKQVHEANIIFCDGKKIIDSSTFADGVYTNLSGVLLGIQTADCLAVFFWSPVDHVIGLAHAGWRGLKAGILPAMVKLFQKDFKVCACDIRVALGPSIRSCCYEVGKEFQDYFPEHYAAKDTSKGCMDLPAQAVDQLVREGVQEKWITDSGLCTVCQNDRFFSFRREKTEERILSVLQLR
jgi:YfiH family protein